MPALALRHAARRLRRAPAFTLAATLTLALGIGAVSAAFALVNGVLLEPLPFAHADRLVDLSHTLQVAGLLHVDQSDATYLLYRDASRSFSGVAAYRSTSANFSATAGGAGAAPPERVAAAIATPSLFRVLGVGAQRGPGMTDADAQPGAAPVVVLSHALWQRDFGGDPSIVGRTVVVDGVERRVAGVMPHGFAFPDAQTALWIPLVLDPAHTASAAFDFRGIARLRDGVAPAAAQRDLQQLLPRVPVVYPGRLTVGAITATHMQAVVQPLRDVIIGGAGRTLWIVLAAVGILLLIACANVANLFLARAEGRHRETAVRRALGASRGALLGDFLAEAVVVATIGAALGLGAAWVALRALQVLAFGASIPRLADVHVDGRVLVVTAGIAAMVAFLVSALPALRAGRASLARMLAGDTRSATSGRGRHAVRRGLVVAQVALALVLLTAAGLLARSFQRLQAVDPGFRAEHAATFRVVLPPAAYRTAADVGQVVDRVLDALRALPGVQAAGAVTRLPLDEEARQDSAVFLEDRPLRPGMMPGIHEIVFVTPGYFRAMGIPVIAGRVFDRPATGADPAQLPRELVVSKAFAERYWKGQDAIGKRIRMNPADPWSTVVGVVGDVHAQGLDQPPTDAVYSPLVTVAPTGSSYAPRQLAFVVRASGAASTLATGARRAVEQVDSSLPLYRVQPLAELLARSLARTTFTLVLLGVAAVMALWIGAMGIYGVLAYLVSLRTREIGVRMALGAQAAEVRALVARQGARDALLGIVAGLAIAVASMRLLSRLLYGVSPVDPVALAGASVALLFTALLASWIPARRAAALDPVEALRAD